MSPNVEALVAEGVKKKKKPGTRGAVTDKIYLWTSGIVPYIIDSAFGKEQVYHRYQVRLGLYWSLDNRLMRLNNSH